MTSFSIRGWLSRFTALERFLLGILSLITVFSASLIGWQTWLEQTRPVPVVGGTYTEGVVAASLADVQPSINQLTRLGLTRFDVDGNIVGAVADRWEVVDEGKTYRFSLNPSVSLELVRAALAENAALFPEIQVEVEEPASVVFRLKQAFAPFLATTTTPIFPVGPFSVEEQRKGEVRLVARPDSLAGAPYLEAITLKMYPDTFNLTQALANGDIEGVADTSHVENDRLLGRLSSWELTLPRQIFLFFNTDRAVVGQTVTRQRLRDGQALDAPIALTLVTLASPQHEQLAEQLVATWSPLGVQVTVETRTATELAKQVVPNRDYDALIYGLDFGADPDPYPFWHSSQIGAEGLNLANFAHIDADRLLEKARQTQRPDERATLYAQFQTIFDREVPAISLEQVSVVFGTDLGLKGVRSHAGLTPADRYRFVTEWYRKMRRIQE
ncbi:ABC transporter substrate-binding protein [Candidatus Berkelbacteria bacterium]|nr:ABC transporter substrate-binding protein [Candidatus Berkelbacteria bacterium]